MATFATSRAVKMLSHELSLVLCRAAALLHKLV